MPGSFTPSGIPGAQSSQPPGFQPPPLRLVAGREVDAMGNMVPQSQPPTSLRVNQQYQQQQQQQQQSVAPPAQEEEEEDAGYDPRLSK